MYNQYNQMPYDCTLKDYRKTYADPKHLKSLKTSCIIGYVLAAVNLLVAVAANPVALVDVVIQIGLILGVQLARSKGCAIALLGYAIFSMVVGVTTSGTPTGWMWLVLGISLVQTFKKIDKEYEEAKAAMASQYQYQYQYPQYPQNPQYPQY